VDKYIYIVAGGGFSVHPVEIKTAPMDGKVDVFATLAAAIEAFVEMASCDMIEIWADGKKIAETP